MSQPFTPDINIGLSEDDRKAVSESLSKVLADAYILYLKTHAAHWNITGPMSHSLHEMFQEQYTEQWKALDEIAERIRALGHFAPGSYAQYSRLASLREDNIEYPADWREVVKVILADNESFCATASAALDMATQVGDEPTVDLMTQRLHEHQKSAWILRSLLQGS